MVCMLSLECLSSKVIGAFMYLSVVLHVSQNVDLFTTECCYLRVHIVFTFTFALQLRWPSFVIHGSVYRLFCSYFEHHNLEQVYLDKCMLYLCCVIVSMGTASSSATVALVLQGGHAPSAAIVVIFTRRFSAAEMYIMLTVFCWSCRVQYWMVSDRSQQ